MEVGIAFFGADALDHALNTHHALQLDPMELQGGKRVASQLVALAAGIVGVPNNAARIQALDQHHARGGTQIAAHGGQRHGIGFGHFGVDGLFQPLVKLLQGVGLGGVLIEFGTFVAFAEVGNGFHGCSLAPGTPWPPGGGHTPLVLGGGIGCSRRRGLTIKPWNVSICR